MYPDWSKNFGIYEVNVRQFSEEASFEKVTEYLPKIKATGINLVWLMPIHAIGGKNLAKVVWGAAIQCTRELYPPTLGATG